MKRLTLISDRVLIPLLIYVGLAGIFVMITLPDHKIYITMAILFPLFFAVPLTKRKSYQELIFMDERYPEKKDKRRKTNCLLFFLFFIGYVAGLCFTYFLKDANLKIALNLGIQLLYYSGVLLLFVDRISCKTNKIPHINNDSE